MSFWVVTAYFNPGGTQSLLGNYLLFAENLKRQSIPLLTVECTFGDAPPAIPEALHLRSGSVLWQKERLLNYGISQLPADCDAFAWVDCDILFPDGWDLLAQRTLDNADVVQCFRTVLSAGEPAHWIRPALVWQLKHFENWKQRRMRGFMIPSPGHAWAARREVFAEQGLYEQDILGSGDMAMVNAWFGLQDCMGFDRKVTPGMARDIDAWGARFRQRRRVFDYVPVECFHLFHGAISNRRYSERHMIQIRHDYDPQADVAVRDNVLEWASAKPDFHREAMEYFLGRKEDQKPL